MLHSPPPISLLCQIDCRELRQSSPLSQVVPPRSRAVIPIIFESSTKGNFQRWVLTHLLCAWSDTTRWGCCGFLLLPADWVCHSSLKTLYSARTSNNMCMAEVCVMRWNHSNRKKKREKKGAWKVKVKYASCSGRACEQLWIYLLSLCTK